jgi:predicted transcriptional regulator
MSKSPVREWSFLTNHAIVLIYLAKQPGSTARQIASAAGISDRTLRRVITDLSNDGYITGKQEGRKSQYSISPTLSRLHDRSRESAFRDFLEILGW